MKRGSIVTLIISAATIAVGDSQQVPGRTVDTDTVYNQTCPEDVSDCGYQITAVDGTDPPTIVDIIDPALLRLELASPVIGLEGVSVLNVTGGRVQTFFGGPAVRAADQSAVNVSGGSLFGAEGGGILAVNQAEVTVSGGNVTSDADSGIAGAIWLNDAARGRVSGGAVVATDGLAVSTIGDSRLTIADGAVVGPVRTDGNSVIDIFGGSFRGYLSIGELTAVGDSTVNIFGGTFEGESAGGAYGITVEDQGAIHVFGASFSLEPLPLNHQRLTGVLADGTPINVRARGNIVVHEGEFRLQPGDANQDVQFDQADVVQVAQAAKYLTGELATWGQGDWDGAPGGTLRNPPPGNGLFDQMDIIAALQSGVYLTGRYIAVRPNGQQSDPQTSIVYDATTGEVSVDAPSGTQLTSINIDSAAGIFTGAAAQNLGGSFDNDADNNIFKATFGSSFGSITFGNVAQPGLSEDFVVNDLSVVGSLAGGGSLGDVDLIYVPEPASWVMLALGSIAIAIGWARLRLRAGR